MVVTHKATHTPGPWRIVVSTYDNGVTDIRGPLNKDKSSDYIASMSGCDDTEANARLIASAPEMLELLKMLFADGIGITSRGPQGGEILDKAEAVIRKARGER